MIKESHVITMKIPFPSVGSMLALSPHMYICIEANYPEYKFVKCQTLKPYMLIDSPVKNYCDEAPDITRNPFTHFTRIDCDKIFMTYGVTYDDKLLTTRRPDICDELFRDIKTKVSADTIFLDEVELVILNNLISHIRQ